MELSNPMREQVFATPGALLKGFDALELNARLAVETPDIYRTRRVVLTGSGDSWFAAKAAELSFWIDAEVAAEIRSPLETGRYQSQLYPRRELEQSLLVALSNSGGAARVAEAATLWRATGAKVLAVTRNDTGRLAGIADRKLLLPVPELPNAPGFGPYLFAVLGLQLLAIRFGEVKLAMTMDEAQALRGQLKSLLATLERVVADLDTPTQQVATALAGRRLVEFVGAGPNYAVAEYGAAKLLEASGRHALARDLEEWTHLNYFDNAPAEIATVLVVPAGSVTESRAVELLAYMHKLGRSLVVVGGGAAADLAHKLGHAVLPIPAIDERWSPLLTSAAPALLAAHLSALDGAAYGRGGNPPWDDSLTAATVQQSAIWEPGK
ncbi:SIS domain-containing protein [Devosia insulae]|uniref:SIS domain-containing protein n=1 Tax=Devosia insulae TaxID=408174 RepID=UPI00114C90D8|nr:SIS domain-containing protein [Devosia insulae]